jgi:adenylate cyclase
MRFFKSVNAVHIFASLLAAFLASAIFATGFGDRVELFFHDTWYQVRGARTAPKDVVVVAMDELSYRNLGVSLNKAWPRELHAKLLDKLAEYGAKKVVFDILFLDPGADPKADEHLASAISKLPVALGVETAIQQVGGAGGSFSLEELLEPYAPFKKAAKQLALVALPSASGYIRGFFNQRTERTQGIPSLAEAGADVLPDQSNLPTRYDLINYYGGARTIPTYSFYQLLEEEMPLDKSLFEGKTVFVGLSLRTEVGPAQKDVFMNPATGVPIFGVEVHAVASANLKSGSWIRRLSPTTEYLILSLATAFGSLIILSVSPVVAGAVTASLALLWSIIAYLSFTQFFFLSGAFVVFITLPVVFLIATFRSFIVARRSELKLKSAFELYVAPEMVSQLQNDQMGTKLGGQKVWATAMFTDIAGFTDITEELPPEKVVEMLNEYFSQIMDVVFKNKGTLIKFIGDAVFVIWGAPVPMDNHASLAMKTAQELQDVLAKFNSLKKYPELKTRIGVNTGPMVVGNLGSDRRFDYTAIGDSINLAARIEGLNKKLGTDVLFTEAVRKDSGLNEGVLPLGDFKVKGKKEAVLLYSHFVPAVSEEIRAKLAEALKFFQRGRAENALKLFDELPNADIRLKELSIFYRSYINKVSDKMLGEEWRGEVELDEK